MFRRILFLAWLLCPMIVGAQPVAPSFTFTAPLDITGPLGTLLQFHGLTDTGTKIGTESRPAGKSYRLDASNGLTAIECPTIPRASTAARGGPDITALNAAGIVVGSDESAAKQLIGIIQKADGSCESYLHPGSVGTILTGVSNSTGAVPFVVGYFWNSPTLTTEPGLLRFHAFLKTSAGVLVLDGPGANDRNYSTGWNSAGEIIMYSYTNINPLTNEYTYQARIRHANGTFENITSPAGHDVCLIGINDAGVVVVAENQCGASGGKAYWYDSVNRLWYEIPKPTAATTVVELRGVSESGGLIGQYLEQVSTGQPPPNDVRFALHGFVAQCTANCVPTAPVTPPPVPRRKTKWQRDHLKQRHELYKEWRQAGHEPDYPVPVVDEDGTVYLVTNDREIGD